MSTTNSPTNNLPTDLSQLSVTPVTPVKPVASTVGASAGPEIDSDQVHTALGGTAGQDLPQSAVAQKAKKQWQPWEIAAVVALVVVVVGAMAFWLKPWEAVWRGQDNKKSAMANALATELSQYFTKRGAYPWNFTVGEYVPDQRRPEAAFAYIPPKKIAEGEEAISRDWLTSFLDVSSLSEEEKKYWLKNDEMYVLKQVSSGNRVSVCFDPVSTKYREAATVDCAEDNLGRRDTAYEVDGFDPCGTINGVVPERKDSKQNLFCVTAGG